MSTFRSAVDDLWKNADYALTAQNNFSPIPVSVAAAAAKAPGVDAVGSVRAGQAKAFGSVYNATAVNPAASRIFAQDRLHPTRRLDDLGVFQFRELAQASNRTRD